MADGRSKCASHAAFESLRIAVFRHVREDSAFAVRPAWGARVDPEVARLTNVDVDEVTRGVDANANVAERPRVARGRIVGGSRHHDVRGATLAVVRIALPRRAVTGKEADLARVEVLLNVVKYIQ